MGNGLGGVRLCDHPGCSGEGDYRAPRSREAVHVFYWFCLDHVRLYNASWNYYAGMSAAEVEAEIRNDTVWQRPTWKLGARVAGIHAARIRDFGMFGMENDEPPVNKKRPPTEEERALLILELEPPFTLVELKARYRDLVKRHHPDIHGGDRASEERLKQINLAYTTLKASHFQAS
ncbi:MAG TPA: J domain-containing protein [Stellaceae bacterium]|nr:J domain-containing protein [Stellaceae bacterium]